MQNLIPMCFATGFLSLQKGFERQGHSNLTTSGTRISDAGTEMTQMENLLHNTNVLENSRIEIN